MQQIVRTSAGEYVVEETGNGRFIITDPSGTVVGAWASGMSMARDYAITLKQLKEIRDILEKK